MIDGWPGLLPALIFGGESGALRAAAHALLPACGVMAVLLVLAWAILRGHGMDRWFPVYCLTRRRRRAIAAHEDVHALICVCDHFAPREGGAGDARAAERLSMWLNQYPALYAHLRDSDGCPPRHTFFYPVEQYRAEDVAAIAALCRRGLGEIEVQIQRGGETLEELRARLIEGRRLLAERHGGLAHHGMTSQRSYGLIHGHGPREQPHARESAPGVDDALNILRETGCYADFTPAGAMNGAAARKINSIYYAVDKPRHTGAAGAGIDVGTGPVPERGLMRIQGPLILNWRRRKGGLFPRVENACLRGDQLATMERFNLWLRARVHVRGREDWFFIKLHCQGAGEDGQRALLGPAMVRFHRDLAERARRDRHFHYHYVTAREMYNLAKAAEAGWKGSVDAARNYVLLSNQILLERKTTA